MQDYLKCNKCSEEDHEGSFCRCLERNMRIAKEQRARGESPWQSLRRERLKPKDHIEDNLELVCDSPNPENK